MARLSREQSGTGIYHVMLRGINRQNIFNDEEDYERFVKVLYQMVYPIDEITGKPLPARCMFYAYCIMSNHVHLLVREASEKLASIIKRIGVAYALYFNINTLLPATESILDFDYGNSSKTDEEVTGFISSRFGLEPIRDKQDDILSQAKAFGASYRQLVRLTGLSYGIIRKA